MVTHATYLACTGVRGEVLETKWCHVLGTGASGGRNETHTQSRSINKDHAKDFRKRHCQDCTRCWRFGLEMTERVGVDTEIPSGACRWHLRVLVAISCETRNLSWAWVPWSNVQNIPELFPNFQDLFRRPDEYGVQFMLVHKNHSICNFMILHDQHQVQLVFDVFLPNGWCPPVWPSVLNPVQWILHLLLVSSLCSL